MELYAYQKKVVKHIIDNPFSGIFLDMGLGKTAITLHALEYFRTNFMMNKVLIIAPRMVVEGTWTDEAAKWPELSDMTFCILKGDIKKRSTLLLKKADVFIISRDLVVWLIEYLGDSWFFDTVVIDEFSSFKNPQAKKYKALLKVRPGLSRLIGLTGTPSPNGLEDLFGQVKMLDLGKRLGRYVTHFRSEYFVPDKMGGNVVYSYRLREGAAERMQEKISDICISMTSEDYLELPELVYNNVIISLDAPADKAYKKLKRDFLLEMQGYDNVISADTAAVLAGKLLQLANGACYDAEGNTCKVHDIKLDRMEELIEELNGSPVLVFYSFKSDKERILERFKKYNIRELKGDQAIKDWNAKKIDILLAHPASCGYGINLQHGGNHIIWFGLNWNLELYMQANKRLHRNGQDKPVFIHQLLIDNTMDLKVQAALAGKEEIQSALISALKAEKESF